MLTDYYLSHPLSYETNLIGTGIQKSNSPLVLERDVTTKTRLLATLSSDP